jgi:hypothetical protein
MTASQPEPERLYVSPQEFAGLSGLSLSTVHRYLKSGRIACLQPGGPRSRILIPRTALLQGERFQELDDETSAGSTASSQPGKRPSSGPRPRWMKKKH